ncbi:hypothetical protein J3E68DRAFT_137612 [Trichoderma sp. SZMC 28012]
MLICAMVCMYVLIMQPLIVPYPIYFVQYTCAGYPKERNQRTKDKQKIRIRSRIQTAHSSSLTGPYISHGARPGPALVHVPVPVQ